MSAKATASDSADQTRQNARCENCGTEFHCGIGDDACWCAVDFPKVIQGMAGSKCLCPRCLASLIQTQDLT